MEEKSRGLSLRKKRSVRPKISAPIAQAGPLPAALEPPAVLEPPPRINGSNDTSRSGSRERPLESREKTADYVKRRYSTRITQLPKDFNAPPVPSLPTIPSQYEPRGSPSPDGRKSSKSAPVAVDLRALEDPNLGADEYVQQLLANASEQDIRDFQFDLGRIRNRTSTDIQHNVTQNRNQFTKISREAEKLKAEMRALRNFMSELTTTLGQTNAAMGISTENLSSRKYANRSSVANLEALWSSHMQELWKRVEGSQKYLPAIPGRHVLHESRNWVELNPATLKPRKRVHLVLLSDRLLVAAEKKRTENPGLTPSPNPQGSSQLHLVADHCWPLQDLDVSDVASSTQGSSGARRSSQVAKANAVNIRVGLESFTYEAIDKSGTEKVTVLAKMRKAIIDARKQYLVEHDERQVNGIKAISSSRPKSAQGHRNLASSHVRDSRATDRQSIFVDVDGRQQSLRWVEGQVDELDIDIALQRFEDAVERIEQLRRVAKSNKSQPMVQDLVDGKVHDQAARLAKLVLRRLVETNSWATTTQQHVSMLTKLGFEAKASEAYLEARSNVIRTRISQCLDEGDLQQYLYQLSYIYFTLIRNTVSIYQSCFPHAMSSACIKWAKEHVEKFNAVLARQLANVDRQSEERRLCLERAWEHAAMLGDVGIDFRNLIANSF